MGLYRRGSTWWMAFYTPAGRIVQTTGTTNKKDAEVIYQEAKRRALAQRHGVVLINPKMTFAELARTFVEKTGFNPHHVDRLKQLLPVFGGFPVTAITRALVDGYRTERCKTVRNATANRDVAVLRRILYWALDEGLLSSNPLMRFRRLPEPKKPKRVLSVLDEEKLLGVLAGHLRTCVLLSLDTGMRRGEVLSLQREYLDVHRQVLVVSKSKTAGGTGREIPWSVRVAEILTPLAGDTGLVVRYQDGALKNIKRSWRTALRRSGIPRLRFHDLRHTFNTRLMEAGVSRDVRKALMGHASSDVNDLYTHVELPGMRAAIQTLDRWRLEQRKGIPPPSTTTQSQGGNDHAELDTEKPEGNAGSPA